MELDIPEDIPDLFDIPEEVMSDFDASAQDVLSYQFLIVTIIYIIKHYTLDITRKCVLWPLLTMHTGTYFNFLTIWLILTITIMYRYNYQNFSFNIAK